MEKLVSAYTTYRPQNRQCQSCEALVPRRERERERLVQLYETICQLNGIDRLLMVAVESIYDVSYRHLIVHKATLCPRSLLAAVKRGRGGSRPLFGSSVTTSQQSLKLCQKNTFGFSSSPWHRAGSMKQLFCFANETFLFWPFSSQKSGYFKGVLLSVLSSSAKELSPAIFSGPLVPGLLNFCDRCLMSCLYGTGSGCE